MQYYKILDSDSKHKYLWRDYLKHRPGNKSSRGVPRIHNSNKFRDRVIFFQNLLQPICIFRHNCNVFFQNKILSNTASIISFTRCVAFYKSILFSSAKRYVDFKGNLTCTNEADTPEPALSTTYFLQQTVDIRHLTNFSNATERRESSYQHQDEVSWDRSHQLICQ